MGAAYLAGLAVGYWRDQEEVRANWSIDRTFEPEITVEEQEKTDERDGKRRSVIHLTGQKKKTENDSSQGKVNVTIQ